MATWVDVLSPTPYVLLHAVDMNITKAEVHKVSGGEWQSDHAMIHIHQFKCRILDCYLQSSVKLAGY